LNFSHFALFVANRAFALVGAGVPSALLSSKTARMLRLALSSYFYALLIHSLANPNRTGSILINITAACSILNSQPRYRFYSSIVGERRTMPFNAPDALPSLAQRVETKVRQWAHGRILNLTVEEVQGQVIISGVAPSRHAKQLALHGALELLSCDRFAEKITIA
jgi:hypothetical protein